VLQQVGPFMPLGTGTISSSREGVASSASRESSSASPWSCCEPCSSLRLRSRLSRFRFDLGLELRLDAPALLVERRW